MRIVFFGTGQFGKPTLKKLVESEHELMAVVTQPDRKRGRGHNVLPTAIKAFIEKAAPEVEILQPEKASSPDFLERLRSFDADMFVVVDYGQILSLELLDIPSKYCINLHPSILPKYRGAAPVNYAILNGEKETGNTIFKMNERMDAGEIIAQDIVEIEAGENAGELLERLSKKGSGLVLDVLSKISCGDENLVPQEDAKATFARKMKKEDGNIDWALSAAEICNKVRAFQPWPGAYTCIKGKTLKVIRASKVEGAEGCKMAGQVVLRNGMLVCAGKDMVRLEEVQLEGKKAMSADDFLRGYNLEEGSILG